MNNFFEIFNSKRKKKNYNFQQFFFRNFCKPKSDLIHHNYVSLLCHK